LLLVSRGVGFLPGLRPRAAICERLFTAQGKEDAALRHIAISAS